MLEHTSQRDAKIKGYPSVLIVGNDKVPATFGDTNALPNYKDLPMLKKMLTSKGTTRKLTAPRSHEDVMPSTSKMQGGSLLAALTAFAKTSAPAFVLTGLAATVAKKRRATRKKRVL
jgi:hypothetical protein